MAEDTQLSEQAIENREYDSTTGAQKVVFSTTPSVSVSNTAPVTLPANSYYHISAAGTYTVKSGAGTLNYITFNTVSAAQSTTVYDNTTSAAPIVAVVAEPATALTESYVLTYETAFSTGLTVTTSGAQDVTVSYR